MSNLRRLVFCSVFSICAFVGIAVAPLELSAQSQAPLLGGAVTSVRWETNQVELQSGALRVRISALSPSVFRVQYTPKPSFSQSFSYATLDKFEFADGQANSTRIDTRDSVGLSTSQLHAILDRNTGRLTFADATGAPISEDATPAQFTGAEFRVARVMPADEHYYGLGEKAGPLDQREHSFSMWNTDAYGWNSSTDPLYQSIPFFLALREGKSYGIFLDNSYRTNFDFGKQSRNIYYFGSDGGELDYYFIYGPDPKRVISQYTALTGRAPLPPLFALGYQQSRYSYYPESQVRDIAREFRARKIPADVIYLDIHYLKDFKAFTIDRERFPHFEGMIKDLGQQGFKTVVITDLHIKAEPGYTPYDQGLAGDHFIKNPDGSVYIGKVWPGYSVFPDFTRQATREWYGGLYGDFVSMGIRGFWNDMNEPSVFVPEKTMPLDTVHRIEEPGYKRVTDHREAHNLLGMQNVRATYEGLLKLQPNLRPFVLTRAAYAGTQRFAATWTGDNSATWEHYRLTLPTLLNLGISGFGLLGNDVGGYAGTATPELVTRWMELGVFTPLYRNHSEFGNGNKEPWAHGPEHEAIRRRYIETRYRLLPYIYTVMEENSRTGVPAMRPLFLEYPSGAPASEDKMFLFGRDLLIAPKLVETTNAYEIALPPGTWFDYWTGEKHPGESRVKLDPPLDVLPVFVRGGAIIPQQAVVQNTDEVPQGPLELRVYPGRECAGSVYIDDGKSFDYQKGVYFRQNFTCEMTRSGVTVKIASAEGSYKPWWRSLRLIFPSTSRASTATVDSQTSKPIVDSVSNTVSLEIAEPAPGKPHVVVLHY